MDFLHKINHHSSNGTLEGRYRENVLKPDVRINQSTQEAEHSFSCPTKLNLCSVAVSRTDVIALIPSTILSLKASIILQLH